jgi:hypothetical protein
MKATTLACYLFCTAADAFLGRYELHTDDTGVEVFFILLATFVLGCWHPRRAWQWALLVGHAHRRQIGFLNPHKPGCR